MPVLQTGVVPAAPAEWNWDAKDAQLLPDSWVASLWYLPARTQAHANQAAKGAFPPLQLTNNLLRSLQAGAAWVQGKGNGRSSPYLPMLQGQGLLQSEGMRAVGWRAIVTATALHPLRPPPARQPPPANSPPPWRPATPSPVRYGGLY